ncbi:MAG: chemotaxis protein CheW [Syntrophales bacterium]|jgi:purine-binding chemotaxis protein CheW|nr:chemotaxis protein CheW [Syntrophales bacterium]
MQEVSVMKGDVDLVIFILDESRFALKLSAVERVVRIVEITLLPKAPDIVLGIIDVQGGIIPVIDVRKRFRFPKRETQLNDQLVIARTVKRTVALLADDVTGVMACPVERIVEGEKVVSGMAFVQGIVKIDDGMILIHDLDTFLSLDEEQRLDDALRESAGLGKKG